MLTGLVLMCMAYILGSVPFGFLVSRYLYGLDIRTKGSGNIGATNVYRNLGWAAGLLTVAGDLGKGVLPVVLARIGKVPPWWAAAVGLGAVLGHCFPIFLRFRGGKGVSTTFAVLAVLNIHLALIVIVIWLSILLIQGRMSVASLSAAAAAPLLVRVLHESPAGLLFFTWVAAVIIFVRHHENIDRLMKGEEKRLF